MRYDKFLPQNRRPQPETTPEPPPPPSAGKRPMSPVQRAYYGIPDKTKETATALQSRDGKTPAGKRRAKNRRARRVNVWRVAFGVLAAGLLFAGIGAALTHPRLNVAKVTVEGNHSITTAKILNDAGAIRGKNIVLLRTGTIRAALLKEPTFEAVTISRVLPDGVKIAVREREPWAALTTADNRCFTMDSHLIPFRSPSVPEKGLPVVALDADAATAKVALGKPLTLPGAENIALCLDWAGKHPDFPVASLEIASDGKLCLNRIGGAQARLGSPFNLQRKLYALELMLQQPDVRTREWEYINLLAYDAPAVKFKPAALLAQNGAKDSADGGASPSVARDPAGRTELP